MNINTVKIVADSSSNVRTMFGVPFSAAPLRIITGEKEYVDDNTLDVYGMVCDLQNYRGKSTTSCPNAEDWLRAFGDAEWVFCVTITGTLSGSYNSAVQAQKMYEELHPDRRVFVLDSLSTGPEMELVLEKIQELVLSGIGYEEICAQITGYTKRTGLLFMLESMRNLANNGRVSPLVAKMAGLLGIRVVGKASDRGDLEPLSKCRGEKRALDTILAQLRDLGFRGGKVHIAHCFNKEAGTALKDAIRREFAKAQIKLYECGGLCSFYAEKGGMLIGFEKG